MVVPRSLMLGSMGLLAASAGAALIYHQKDNISFLFSGNPHASIYRVGLYCGEARKEGSDCRIYPGGKILVRRGGEDILEVTELGGGKIRLYRVEGEDTYREGFRFTIEDNDIATSKGDSVLGELETYGIEEHEGKHILSRKSEAKDEIKGALGLPCDLPGPNGNGEECDISQGKLSKIKFGGKTGATVSGGSTKLTISPDTSKGDYPLGYRFTFRNEGSGDSILKYGDGTVALKMNSPVDFRIGREGMNLSLEKAWTLETLASRVGLKRDGGYWAFGEKGLNIRQENKGELGRRRASNQEGKIRAYEGQEGYNEGFRFSIENGDLNLEYKKDSALKLLGRYEIYEIKKEGDGMWYLTRLKDARKVIKDSLSLPCDLPGDGQDSVECNGNISSIRFSGSNVSTQGTPKLTIRKEELRQFYPLGYRFSFTSGGGESSITVDGVKISLKEGVNTDFKIRVESEGKLSLERAWTAESLMENAGFRKEGDAWTLGDGSMKVKQGNRKSYLLTRKGDQSGKIKLYEGVPGYNQGFKFAIEDGNLTFEEGFSIGSLGKYETYEVSEDPEGNLYLTRKQSASETIKERLGIPGECTMPNHETPTPTCNLDSQKLKSIKFSGKGDNEGVTIGSDSVTLRMDRVESNDFPLKHRFTFVSEKEINIPQNGGQQISIKPNTNTEFRIKEEGGSLTLERAWTPGRLGGKIGLSECNSGENKCSFGEKISVYESDDARAENASITNGSGKKIKYEEEQANYNQGIKFTVEEDMCLANWTTSGKNPPGKISKEDGVSYEIMEKKVRGKDKWYLVKKG